MSAASLHKRKFDSSRLEARFVLDKVSKSRSNAAELSVTEAVSCAGFAQNFADKFAFFVVDTFRNDSDTFVVLLRANAFYVLNELVDIEINFGKINKIRAESFVGSEFSSGGKPACVSAHTFDNANHRGVVNSRVEIYFHNGGSDVFSRRSVPGTVIGSVKVVVDCFGNADYVAIVAGFSKILRDLVAGVHGIVSAVIEEETNVIFFEYFENSLIIGVVYLRVFKFVSYRT